MDNSKNVKNPEQIADEEKDWNDFLEYEAEDLNWNDIFKDYEKKYNRTRRKVVEQFEELSNIQNKYFSPFDKNDLWITFIESALIIGIIALYYNDQVLPAFLLALTFLVVRLEVTRENIKSAQRNINQRLIQSGEIVHEINGSLNHLFHIQGEKDKIIKKQLKSFTSDIDLNTYRIENLQNITPPETSSDALEKPSNGDIDEKMIEYQNWDFNTTFLLLKKISNEEFETPVPEIVLKRIVHMCDHTDKNELDQDDIKNIKDFTGSKDVINRILKALNIELFIRSIDDELEEIFNTTPDEHGAVHFVWQVQKKYLKEKYNIDWLSLQDLKPELDFF